MGFLCPISSILSLFLEAYSNYQAESVPNLVHEWDFTSVLTEAIS